MARPIDPTAKRHPVATRLDDKGRAWLELWRPGGNAADQLSDLIDRAMLFWPGGPDKGPRQPDPETPRPTRLTNAVALEAKRRGITKNELINEMYADYKGKQ